MSVIVPLRMVLCSLLMLICALLTSCQSSSVGEVEAINNRPQTWTKFVALVRLEGDPLLATLTRDDAGSEVIDAQHKEALLAEQERVIAELLALSDEVMVLYRYRLVLNAIAIVAPEALRERIEDLAGVAMVANETFFNPPQPYVVGDEEDEGTAEQKPLTADSAAFIGSRAVHEKLRVPNREGELVPVRGDGVRVAVIDTGIDYMHKMFGGIGNVDDYKNNDPAVVEPDTFPTDKVVAGIDLVGADYNPMDGNFERHIPRGDADPLDEGMHGTHVAGTVAGIGDGVNTYDGVAPDASLLAIKVFGAGSTSDVVIIKALEYALDPNGDLDLSDRSHVANLSLGSGFGGPNALYRDAISNALRGGMVVVAAAGNSGAYDYIVGAPSTADASISVAASIDDAEHNWKIPAIEFSHGGDQSIVSEAVESSMAKSLNDVGELTVSIHHIGLADQDLTAEQKEQLQGKVALIDRGLVTFVAKIDRAVAAGAIGVVMINNVDGTPIQMGGESEYQIPAVMITKQAGEQVKTALQNGEVNVTFKPDTFMEKRELIDTLASFSSHGPRNFDSLLKPEITAPGVAITSAFAGHGERGIRVSGTSMAAPHVSGVVALLRQYRAALDPVFIKSMLTANAKIIHSSDGERYRTYQQGGGRVEALQAAMAEVVFQPAALSLGRVLVSADKRIAGHFDLRNISEKEVTVTLHAEVMTGLTFDLPAQVTLAAGAEERVNFALHIAADKLNNFYTNLDGYIEARSGEQTVARLPLVVGVKRLARLQTQGAVIHAGSQEESYRALVDVEFVNKGASDGEVLLFNLLGGDGRVENVRRDYFSDNAVCDLQSAGYRVVEQKIDGQREMVLQFAAKLYHPRTTWNFCALSVQFDADGDGVAEQELVGDTVGSILEGAPNEASQFLSFLTDAHKLRAIRSAYELDGKPQNYSGAVVSYLPLRNYNNATLVVASALLRDVVTDAEGDLHLRLAVERVDRLRGIDYLSGHDQNWQTVTPTKDGVGFWGMPAGMVIPAGGTGKATLSRGGELDTRLIAYFPHNASTFSPLRADYQSHVLRVSYQP